MGVAWASFFWPDIMYLFCSWPLPRVGSGPGFEHLLCQQPLQFLLECGFFHSGLLRRRHTHGGLDRVQPADFSAAAPL